MARILIAIKAWMDHVFVPRELLLRSRDKVRHVRFSPAFQKSIALALLLVIGWSGFSSISFFEQAEEIRLKEAEINKRRLDYAGLLNEVDAYHRQFNRIKTDLEETQGLLIALLEAEDADKAAAAGAGIQGKSEEDLQRARDTRDILRDRMSQFETELKSIVAKNDALSDRVALLKAHLEASEEEREAINKARSRLGIILSETENNLEIVKEKNAALAIQIDGLNARLLTLQKRNGNLTSERDDLEQRLRDTQNTLAAALEREEDLSQRLAAVTNESIRLSESLSERTKERDQLERSVVDLERNEILAAKREESLTREVAGLEIALSDALGREGDLRRERDGLDIRLSGAHKRIEQLQEIQVSALEVLEEKTAFQNERLIAMIAETGLKVDKALELDSAATTGVGGPFLPVDGLQDDLPDQSWLSAYEELSAQVAKRDEISRLVVSLPVTVPIDGDYRVSSRYGYRKDPFNGRKSMHSGIDFAAPYRTPILASAPGKVIFAGRRAGFGRVVEIDHGFGLVTRYAHMRKIEVKKGQQVVRHQRIGQVGSSGRSSGPHLHYEIHFAKKAKNPKNFLGAGGNVQ